MSSLTLSQIENSLQQADNPAEDQGKTRILFVPNKISANNLKEVSQAYETVSGTAYESVVIIESFKGSLEKKLAMLSNRFFETEFGEVPVNDGLRNEFCDEEDDFFISDQGFHEDMSLFDQLKMLQATLKNFDVVNLQIGDYDPAIVRELAYVLQDVLGTRNILLVLCCDIPAGNTDELIKLRSLILDKNESELMHYLNSGEKRVSGARAFMTGILVAKAWGLNITLLDGSQNQYICGFAQIKQPVRQV